MEAIFSHVMLVSTYHWCKEEVIVINFVLHYLIDIIYKTAKPSHLVKIKNHTKELN